MVQLGLIWLLVGVLPMLNLIGSLRLRGTMERGCPFLGVVVVVVVAVADAMLLKDWCIVSVALALVLVGSFQPEPLTLCSMVLFIVFLYLIYG